MRLVFAVFCVFSLCIAAAGPHPAAARQDNPSASYSEVDAIFQTRCINCHAGARAASGLRLDSYANSMTGSRNGPVILPGKPAQSPIVKFVKGQIQPRMPKNGPPWLTDAQVSVIEQWIASGASE